MTLWQAVYRLSHQANDGLVAQASGQRRLGNRVSPSGWAGALSTQKFPSPACRANWGPLPTGVGWMVPGDWEGRSGLPGWD